VIDEVLAGGTAAACGRLAAGDRLVSVCEELMRNGSVEQAVEAITRRRSVVPLRFERVCGGDDDGCAIELEESAEEAAAERIVSVVDAGAAVTIGARRSQEDTHVLTSFELPDNGTPRRYVLAAAFDGHRGAKASAYAAMALPSAVMEALRLREVSPLSVAWRDVCKQYRQTDSQDGSTATALLIRDDGRYELLNCGDSRSVIAVRRPDGLAIERATLDHSAASSTEIDRIHASGGSVECFPGGDWRVAVDSPVGVWRVGVARSLGGSEWQAGCISNVADVATSRIEALQPDDVAYAVIATDGVWGTLGPLESCPCSAAASKHVISIVDSARSRGLGAGDAAQEVLTCAKREGETDNATCLIIYLGVT